MAFLEQGVHMQSTTPLLSSCEVFSQNEHPTINSLFRFVLDIERNQIVPDFSKSTMELFNELGIEQG